MSRMPRILPLTAVAIGGVLAINAVAHGPSLLSAAKAVAEDVGAVKPDAKQPGDDASAAAAPASKAPAPVCAPTAAELAQEAGLSPAELQVLQSLGARRGELDQRESDLETQVNLIAAAEAKLDARIQQMNGLKSDIQSLLGQADDQQQAESARLIKVYEAMAPKDAAARMALMSDPVLLPIASKMKERILAAVLAKMQPEDAKALTEKLASRVAGSQTLKDAQTALNPPPAAPAQPAQAAPAAQTAQATPADTAAAGDTTTTKAKPAKHKRLAKAKPAQTQAVAKASPPAAPPTAAAKPATTAAGATPAPAAKAG